MSLFQEQGTSSGVRVLEDELSLQEVQARWRQARLEYRSPLYHIHVLQARLQERPRSGG